MILENIMLSEKKRLKQTNIVCVHICEIPGAVEYIQTEGRIVVTRAWGEGELVNGYRVSMWDEENVWE